MGRLPDPDRRHPRGALLVGGSVTTFVALVFTGEPMVAAATRWDRIGRWFDEAAMVVPLALSAATLGLGFLVAFSGVHARPPGYVDRRAVGAGGIRSAAVVVRHRVAAAAPVDGSLLDAAAVSGARPVSRFTSVVWPTLRRPVGVASRAPRFRHGGGRVGATGVPESVPHVRLSRRDRPTARQPGTADLRPGSRPQLRARPNRPRSPWR